MLTTGVIYDPYVQETISLMKVLCINFIFATCPQRSDLGFCNNLHVNLWSRDLNHCVPYDLRVPFV